MNLILIIKETNEKQNQIYKITFSNYSVLLFESPHASRSINLKYIIETKVYVRMSL